MISSSLLAGPVFRALHQTVVAACGAAVLVLAGCGGSADAPPPPEGGPPQAIAPTITQQPTALTVTVGQPASFTVAATGTAPLAYQWQRNGVDIAGATTTTYAIAATVLGDSGAVFHAVVTNVAGSATSNNATLTVVAAAPVLTITQQPANTSVVAGTAASFTVAGTCSSGTLVVQWQRSQGSGATLTFADIAGATALTYTLPSTVIGDSGAQFRANLTCSGQSATTSNAATLTVTPPGGVTLSLLPLVGLRDQAEIPAITGIDQDAGGSFTFITGNRIKRLSADLSTITPVAGANGSGSADGAAATALFSQPFALTQDSVGILYVADSGNNTIRRIAIDGTVSTLAGLAGSSGTTDGTGSAARFNSPSGIAIGPDGDLYVAERNSHLIRRVTTAGVVTTYAGSTVGYLDGTALTAKFNNPFGVAVAANGDVLVGDANNNRIRRIVRNGNVAGPVQTLAGDGTATPASPDGIGVAAVISSPLGIVVRGNALTLRDGFGLLRQTDLTSAAVTTLTGSRSLGAGYADGTATTARIRDASFGVTGAANGGFMLGDADGLRLVSAVGAVRTIAHGTGATTPLGVGVLAQLPFIVGVGRRVDVTVDPSGNIIVADELSTTVRRIDPAGVATFAAGLVGSRDGPIDGIGSEAQFFGLWDVITDSAGVIYVSDGVGSVRRIAANGATTLFAGSTVVPGGLGYVDGNGAAARFNFITGLAFGSGGNIFVGDRGNNVIRRIDSAGNVTTYAGVAGQAARVDGPIATARFQSPNDVVSGPDGSLYVLDKPDNITGTIRRITPDGASVSTLAGSGGQVRIFTIDAAGTIYYADDFTTSLLGGLWMLPAGATTPTRLIQYTNGNVVLGSNPRIGIVDSIAVLGPKRILLASGSQLLVATLP